MNLTLFSNFTSKHNNLLKNAEKKKLKQKNKLNLDQEKDTETEVIKPRSRAEKSTKILTNCQPKKPKNTNITPPCSSASSQSKIN